MRCCVTAAQEPEFCAILTWSHVAHNATTRANIMVRDGVVIQFTKEVRMERKENDLSSVLAHAFK